MSRPLIQEIKKIEVVAKALVMLLSRLKHMTYVDERRDSRLRKKAGFKSKRKVK